MTIKKRSDLVQDNTDNEVVHIINNPIITNEYSVYLNTSIGEAHYYRALFNLLRNAEPVDRFIIYINNYGGYVHTGIDIINSMKASAAPTTVVITGPLYSMAPLIALSADLIKVEDNSFMMFHDYSGDTTGKGSEQLASVLHHKPFFDNMFAEITKDFLTKQEVKDITSGQDLYLNRNEVVKRLKKMKKLIVDK